MTALVDRIREIRDYAEENGWATEVHATQVDGCAEALQLVGVRFDGHPDNLDGGVQFGFGLAMGLNPETGRVITLDFDRPGRKFVVTLEDGSNRYWHGPLSAWKRALEDPCEWTGVMPAEPEAGVR